MNTNSDNHDAPLRPDEAELLDLLEGHLPEPRARALRAALADDPALAAWVTSIVRDRAMLRSIDDVPAPASLLESIETALERDALLGLSAGDVVPAPIPITRVYTQPRWPKRAAAGLAVAAALALVGGAVFIVASRPAPSPIPERTVAIDDSPGLLPDDAPAPERLALDRGAPPADDLAAPFESDRVPPPAIRPHEEPGRVIFTDAERAAELLAEGRLLVRVRAADARAAAERVERLSSASQRARAWRLLTDSPESVRLAVADAIRSPLDPPPAFGPDYVAAVERLDRSAPHLAARDAETPPLVLYLAEARTDRASLAALLAALSTGDRQQAVFEELPEPLAMPPVVTPESVLWWAEPPSSWSLRTHVPVVVERIER